MSEWKAWRTYPSPSRVTGEPTWASEGVPTSEIKVERDLRAFRRSDAGFPTTRWLLVIDEPDTVLAILWSSVAGPSAVWLYRKES